MDQWNKLDPEKDQDIYTDNLFAVTGKRQLTEFLMYGDETLVFLYSKNRNCDTQQIKKVI
jgi:hypothetical protein